MHDLQHSLVMSGFLVLYERGFIRKNSITVIAKGNSLFLLSLLFSDHNLLVVRAFDRHAKMRGSRQHKHYSCTKTSSQVVKRSFSQADRAALTHAGEAGVLHRLRSDGGHWQRIAASSTCMRDLRSTLTYRK